MYKTCLVVNPKVPLLEIMGIARHLNGLGVETYATDRTDHVMWEDYTCLVIFYPADDTVAGFRLSTGHTGPIIEVLEGPVSEGMAVARRLRGATLVLSSNQSTESLVRQIADHFRSCPPVVVTHRCTTRGVGGELLEFEALEVLSSVLGSRLTFQKLPDGVVTLFGLPLKPGQKVRIKDRAGYWQLGLNWEKISRVTGYGAIRYELDTSTAGTYFLSPWSGKKH